MIEIHWTVEARHTLADIRDYITEIEHAPLNAEKVLRRLINRVEQLRVSPQSGRSVPDYRDTQIRELLEKPYRIIYLIVNEERIDILSLMHYRQLLPKKREILQATRSIRSKP